MMQVSESGKKDQTKGEEMFGMHTSECQVTMVCREHSKTLADSTANQKKIDSDLQKSRNPWWANPPIGIMNQSPKQCIIKIYSRAINLIILLVIQMLSSSFF